MEEWRLLDVETPENAAMNMAIDESIFLARVQRVAPPTVRFYRNKRAVVIGYSQSVDAEVNLELCEKEGIQVVRRISGGGAVYHDLGNMNYTVVIDADHRLIGGLDVAESHRVLCFGVIEGLKRLGIAADFRPLSDIFIGDRKISGSAQSRKRGIVLHHGTLLVDADLQVLVRVLDVERKTTGRKDSTSARKLVTRLTDELGYKIDLKELRKAFVEGFERAFGIGLRRDKLTPMEENLARNLHDGKYSRKEWNFLR